MFRLLQALDPPQQGLHVQGGRRDEGPLSRRQDAPEPVQGMPARQVLPGEHEQGW